MDAPTTSEIEAPEGALPLLVAALCRRSRNAKSAKDRHDLAYYAFEASLRLGVAARPPLDVRGLYRGMLGDWGRAFEPARARLEHPALARVYSLLVDVGQQRRTERATLAARELVEAWIAYRNRVLGHGTARTSAFYESAAELLLGGVRAAWNEGLFWSASARLRYVEAVRIASDGRRYARVFDLDGETPRLLDESAEIPSVVPQRVYLEQAGSRSSLWPFVAYDVDTERFFCFTGIRRSAEFLDYVSGTMLRGIELERIATGVEAELRSRSEGTPVTSAPSASPPAATSAGAAPEGGLRTLCELGRGATGVVDLAWQAELERVVAVKRLAGGGTLDPVASARFAREARALANLDDPHIVRVLALDGTEGEQRLVMEFVPGVDLRDVATRMREGQAFLSAVRAALAARRAQLCAAFPQLPWNAESVAEGGQGDEAAFVRCFHGAALGLAHAHARGIVHRDISPGNVMVTLPGPRAVLMDFGLAAFRDRASELTAAGEPPLGTLRFAAPERLNPGRGEFEPRSDVYSLGAVMYELASCSPLFEAPTAREIMHRIQFDEPAWLRRLRPEVSRDLEAVIHQAVAKRPQERYASAAELAEDLSNLLEGKPVAARTLSTGYRAFVQLRRNKARIGVALGLLAALGLGAYATARWIHREDESSKKGLATTIEEFQRMVAQLPERTRLELEPGLRNIKVAAGLAPVVSEDQTSRSIADEIEWGALPRETRELLDSAMALAKAGEPVGSPSASDARALELEKAIDEVARLDAESGSALKTMRALGQAALRGEHWGPAAKAWRFVADGADRRDGAGALTSLQALEMLGWSEERGGDPAQAEKDYTSALDGYRAYKAAAPQLARMLPVRIAGTQAAQRRSEQAFDGLRQWIERWGTASGEKTRIDGLSHEDQLLFYATVAALTEPDRRIELLDATVLTTAEAGEDEAGQAELGRTRAVLLGRALLDRASARAKESERAAREDLERAARVFAAELGDDSAPVRWIRQLLAEPGAGTSGSRSPDERSPSEAPSPGG